MVIFQGTPDKLQWFKHKVKKFPCFKKFHKAEEGKNLLDPVGHRNPLSQSASQ